MAAFKTNASINWLAEPLRGRNIEVKKIFVSLENASLNSDREICKMGAWEGRI